MATSSTTSISGLSSGLDTATIVNQLMQLEAASQTKLKSRMTTEQTQLKATQSLNAKVAALATAAANLAKPATWASVTATSSTATVAVKSTVDAAPGALRFTVDQLATAHRLTSVSTAALTDVVTSGSTHVTLTAHDGTVTDIDTGDGTLQGLVTAINASGTNVRASTVSLDGGQQRLRLQSLTTGATSDFSLANTDGSPLLGGSTITAGTDAAITIEGDTIHSSTNTFAGVLPGIDVTVGTTTPVGTTVDVALVSNPSALSDSIKAYVDAVNSVMSDIDTQSTWNATTKTSGVLSGEPAVRALRNELLSAVYPKDGSSMASVGVQLDRSGKLVFDADTFATEYAKSPGTVAAAFTSASTTNPGFAERVGAVAKSASDSLTGTLTASINGGTTGIKRLQDSIDAWDIRLALRRTTLNNQFTALETAMSKMQSQSTWLTSQLNSLSSNSSSSGN